MALVDKEAKFNFYVSGLDMLSWLSGAAFHPPSLKSRRSPFCVAVLPLYIGPTQSIRHLHVANFTMASSGRASPVQLATRRTAFLPSSSPSATFEESAQHSYKSPTKPSNNFSTLAPAASRHDTTKILSLSNRRWTRTSLSRTFSGT